MTVWCITGRIFFYKKNRIHKGWISYIYFNFFLYKGANADFRARHFVSNDHLKIDPWSLMKRKFTSSLWRWNPHFRIAIYNNISKIFRKINIYRYSSHWTIKKAPLWYSIPTFIENGYTKINRVVCKHKAYRQQQNTLADLRDRLAWLVCVWARSERSLCLCNRKTRTFVVGNYMLFNCDTDTSSIYSALYIYVIYKCMLPIWMRTITVHIFGNIGAYILVIYNWFGLEAFCEKLFTTENTRQYAA